LGYEESIAPIVFLMLELDWSNLKEMVLQENMEKESDYFII